MEQYAGTCVMVWSAKTMTTFPFLSWFVYYERSLVQLLASYVLCRINPIFLHYIHIHHDIQNLCGYTRKYNNRKVFRQSEITACTIAIYRIYGTAYDITRLVACLRVYIFPSWPLLVDSFCKFKLFAMSAEVPDQEFVIVLYIFFCMPLFLIHFNFGLFFRFVFCKQISLAFSSVCFCSANEDLIVYISGIKLISKFIEG